MKNIGTWSQKKLRAWYFLGSLILLGLQLVAPIVVICCNYKLFKHTTEANVLNGFGLVCIIVFGILGLKSFKKIIDKMEDISYKEQRIKYFLQMLYAIAIPGLCTVVLLCFKSNFKQAYKTFCIGLIFYVVGILWDYMFMKFIEREKEFRHIAKEKIEVDKRIDIIKSK